MDEMVTGFPFNVTSSPMYDGSTMSFLGTALWFGKPAGIALSASAGLDFSSRERPKPLPIKPGSAGKAMPGFDVRVVDDDGNEVKQGDMGNIVMSIPLAPTAFTTLWEDEERFYKGYMKRFNGKWIDTGDAGMIDDEGYISIMARADDVINVAAHRFSTGELCGLACREIVYMSLQ